MSGKVRSKSGKKFYLELHKIGQQVILDSDSIHYKIDDNRQTCKEDKGLQITLMGTVFLPHAFVPMLSSKRHLFTFF